MSDVRVLSQAAAADELRKLAVAGLDRRAAITRLRSRGVLLPVAGGSPDDPPKDPPPADPKPDPKPAPAPADPPANDGDRIPKARLDAEAEKRKEAERERDELRKQLEAKNDQDLSDLQREQKRAEKAETRADTAERAWRDALVRSYAVEAGALDADTIVALAANDATIKFGDDATVKAAVERIKTEKGVLFSEPKPGGGLGLAGGGSSSAPGATPPGAGDGDDPKASMGKDLLTALTGGGRG